MKSYEWVDISSVLILRLFGDLKMFFETRIGKGAKNALKLNKEV